MKSIPKHLLRHPLLPTALVWLVYSTVGFLPFRGSWKVTKSHLGVPGKCWMWGDTTGGGLWGPSWGGSDRGQGGGWLLNHCCLTADLSVKYAMAYSSQTSGQRIFWEKVDWKSKENDRNVLPIIFWPQLVLHMSDSRYTIVHQRPSLYSHGTSNKSLSIIQ